MASPILNSLKILATPPNSQVPEDIFPTHFTMEVEGSSNNAFPTKEWTFHRDYLARQNSNFYRRIVPGHILLNLELSVLRARLAKDLHKLSTQEQQVTAEEKAQILHRLEAAFIVSSILEKLHSRYLNVPREEARLRRNKNEYRQWLEEYGNYQFNDIDFNLIDVQSGVASTQAIRDTMRDLNPLRLILVRLRRLLLIMSVVLSYYAHDYQWISAFVNYTAPYFSYLAWLFFVPRLLVNIALSCKHIINHPWMSEEENALGWYARLQGQLERRWPEMANDMAWFLNGIFLCFIITGPLSIVKLAIFMQAYDFFFSILRAGIDIWRYGTLEKTYQKALDEAQESDKEAIRTQLQDLQQRIVLEQKMLVANLVNFGVLFGAILLILPEIAILSPILPLAGAAITVLVTLTNFFITRHYDKQRRQDYLSVNLPPLTRFPKPLINHHKFQDTVIEQGPEEPLSEKLDQLGTPIGRFHPRVDEAERIEFRKQQSESFLTSHEQCLLNNS